MPQVRGQQLLVGPGPAVAVTRAALQPAVRLDEGPDAVAGLDQALSPQDAQRLADRRQAHPEPFDQRRLRGVAGAPPVAPLLFLSPLARRSPAGACRAPS